MDDIVINGKISVGLNNRIIVFHDEDNNILDGREFHALCSYNITESFDNYLYLKKYLKKFYSFDFSLKHIIDNSYNFKQNEALFILLEQYNEAIFQEVTVDSQLNDCHRAVFYLPSLISSKQKEVILGFADYFRNFSQIVLCNVNATDSHTIEQVPFALIDGNDIDKLEQFLLVKAQYTKLIGQ